MAGCGHVSRSVTHHFHGWCVWWSVDNGMTCKTSAPYTSSVQRVDRQAASADIWVETADGPRSSTLFLPGPARTPRVRPPPSQQGSPLRWQRGIPGSFSHEVRLPWVCQLLGRLVYEHLLVIERTNEWTSFAENGKISVNENQP